MKSEKNINTLSSDYNSVTAKTQGNYEIYNSTINRPAIFEILNSGRGLDLIKEPKKNGEPVMITGSGPSLDNTVEKLKEWKGGIICHYSQAVTLMYFGIEPDYIVALDAICNWEGLSSVDWSKAKTKIITHPGVWPSIINHWPNEFLFFRQNVGLNNGFSKTTQKTMYSELESTLEEALKSTIKLRSLINTEITMFACTPPVQLICAQLLGYGTAFLTGLDFCYFDDKMRFSDYVKKDAGKWEKRVYPIQENVKYIKTITGFLTENLHMYYKKNFLSAWRLSLHPTITTDKAAITELPYADFNKVIEKQGRGIKNKPREQVVKKVEKYLAVVNCFAVQHEKGMSFVEATELKAIEQYIDSAMSHYACSNCGANATSKDGQDYTGWECKRCHGGKMQHVNSVDKESNIKRIKWLMEYAKEIK